MEKVILLKTQLAEAALLAKKRTYPNDRLAVILLDNFVEIQLSSIMKNKFDFDGTYNREKKYSFVVRKKILNNYDDLLRACVEEKAIESKDLRLLAFVTQFATIYITKVARKSHSPELHSRFYMTLS